MSLFTDASLVYVPSGVKDGKTYSITPTDGSGDLTFSRGSDIEATRVASNGYIEKAKVNLLLQSNSFDTTWANTDTTETGGQSGYDGSSDAWEIGLTDAGGRLQETNSQSGVQTFSVYAKAGTLDFVRLRATTTGANVDGYFNLSSGTYAGSVTGGVIDANIESVGGGWYRCSLTYDKTNTDIRIYPAIAYDDLTATSGTIYIQDAQLNYGLVAQEYQETTTTSVVSGITNDLPRLDYSGGASCPSLLLEPSRTNLFENSEYIEGWSTSNTGLTVEENATNSPEGLLNAAKIKEDGTNASHAARNLTGPTLTSGTDYTFSFFAKKGERSIVALSNTIGASNDKNCFFDLENGEVLTNTFNSASIEDYGNDWFRCIATDTADAADDYDTRIYTATADNQFSHQGVLGSGLYIYGIQLEAGSYPTSYIPTYGTSATRTADACSKTGISSLIGQTEGTLFVEFQISNITSSVNKTWVAVKDAAQNNRVLFYVLSTSPDTLRAQIKHGGTAINFNLGTFTANTTYKIAIGYKSGDSVIYLNGSSVATNTNALTFGTMDIFDFNDANAPFEGEVNQALLFTTRLSNADLATLTA